MEEKQGQRNIYKVQALIVCLSGFSGMKKQVFKKQCLQIEAYRQKDSQEVNSLGE